MQCIVVCYKWTAVRFLLQYVAVYYRVANTKILQYVAVCCSMLQYVAEYVAVCM